MSGTKTGNEMYEKYRGPATRVIYILGALTLAVIALLALNQIRNVILMFFYASIIVYLARPFVDYMQAHRVPRIIAVLVAYLAVFSLLAVFIFYVVPLVVGQSAKLFAHILPSMKEFLGWVGEKVPQPIVDQIKSQAGQIAGTIAANLPAVLVGLFGGVASFALSWVIAFYLLSDLPGVLETIMKIIPSRWRRGTLEVSQVMNKAVWGYLKGQVIDSLAVGFLTAIYFLAIGVDFAILLGFIAAIFNVIPYFGAFISGALAVIVALSNSPEQALLVIVGMVVISQIEAAVISPLAMKHTVSLHPAAVIFALTAGGTLFGFLGLIVSIPVAAAAKALMNRYLFDEPAD
jgi:predicted PurR-regulated permease PerM